MTYPTTYDYWIEQSWAAHMPPEYNWLWGKAQLIAESNLDPRARSPVGALGLAQFMPATWADVKDALNFPTIASPLDPQQAIQGYCWYMRHLLDKWTTPRPPLDRLHLAQASYNAGLENIVRAQNRANMATGYLDIIAALPRITGPENARQTQQYVTRIGAIFLELTSVNIPGTAS